MDLLHQVHNVRTECDTVWETRRPLHYVLHSLGLAIIAVLDCCCLSSYHYDGTRDQELMIKLLWRTLEDLKWSLLVQGCRGNNVKAWRRGRHCIRVIEVPASLFHGSWSYGKDLTTWNLEREWEMAACCFDHGPNERSIILLTRRESRSRVLFLHWALFNVFEAIVVICQRGSSFFPQKVLWRPT